MRTARTVLLTLDLAGAGVCVWGPAALRIKRDGPPE